MKIDLRSDTVTKPTEAMLQAMLQAQVGDDVYGEDTEVSSLETCCASLFGHEAALFCPSGTMTNQIAIQLHTRRGDEVICADIAHIYKYEGGGIAAQAHAQARTIKAEYGIIDANQITTCINSDDPHFAHTALVSIENTSNRGGGACYSLNQMQAISDLCKQYNIPLHLDGARIFNAMVALDINPIDLGKCFQTISICLSKGLGAPVGSVLIGSQQLIHQAKRIRKRMGGSMRQAGYLAAAGKFALTHHIDRLAKDHEHAQIVRNALSKIKAIKNIYPCPTNIIIFECETSEVCNHFQSYLLAHQIMCNKVSEVGIRFVFHLDVTAEMIQKIVATISLYEELHLQRA
jgi:threonine aldolase